MWDQCYVDNNPVIPPEEFLLLFTTLPDKDSATQLATHLVTSQLAACVHVLAQGESFYIWEGAIHKEAEWTLLIKTTSSNYLDLESKIKELHPYDLPEIIATKIAIGEPKYLHWLAQSTKNGTI
jgi:periplasmic divalent cation tolerance protein